MTYTRCPACETTFRVGPEQLEAAGGRVRCGQCSTVFDARAQQVDAPPAEKAGPARRPGETEYGEVNIEALLKLPEGQEEPPPAREPPRQARPAPRPAPPPPPPEELPPVLAQKTPPPSPSALATLIWGVLSLALIGLLLGQYAYRNRLTLARYPELRPWMQQLCTVAGCTLPPRRDLAAIELLSRNIGPDPGRKNALLITARLRNQARFAQPYPDVAVTLRDLNGKVVATGRFTPSEYLPAAAPHRFRPGSTAHLRLQVADPGPRAVSYQFTFH